MKYIDQNKKLFSNALMNADIAVEKAVYVFDIPAISMFFSDAAESKVILENNDRWFVFTIEVDGEEIARWNYDGFDNIIWKGGIGIPWMKDILTRELAEKFIKAANRYQ